MKNKKSGMKIALGTGVFLAVIVTYAFWPRATMVDMGTSARAPMQVTIDEEARTRIHDAYVVSAPVPGRLLRVDVEPGDVVKGGETIVARMMPLPPSPLDIRTREQALAAEGAAGAALRVAQADLNKAVADKDLADLELERARTLRAGGSMPEADLDRASRAAQVANAALDTARAAISMREAELASARAQLISFNDPRPAGVEPAAHSEPIPLKAPVSGRVLQVIQKSETTLAGGTSILEIGNVSNDLEIVVELLSTDAVRVTAGNPVIIEKWGGDHPLEGVVERVEPWGYTKYSALGVEEQRVRGIIKFTSPLNERAKLGHGFRVEVRIVVWEAKDALTVPASALFRQGDKWAVFTVEGGRAALTGIEVGANNGLQAQVLRGLEAGQKVILYPAPGLADGSRVQQRAID